MTKLFFLGFLLCLNSHAGTILIDPGHGGEENGAVSTIDGTREKDLALELSMLIRNHFAFPLTKLKNIQHQKPKQYF